MKKLMILSAAGLVLLAACNKGKTAASVLADLNASEMKSVSIGGFSNYGGNDGTVRWGCNGKANICHISPSTTSNAAGNGHWISNDKETAIGFLKSGENMRLYKKCIHDGKYTAPEDYQFAIFSANDTHAQMYSVKAGIYPVGEDDSTFCIVLKYKQ